MSELKIIISGGGTGGHIFPAISIANAVRELRPDAKILFVGAEGRMEMQRVPAAGYEIVGLPVQGFDRKNLFKNISVLWKLMKSRRMAKRIISDFQPNVVVGVGGYASGPTLNMAAKADIPTLIQEQNSYAGVTNKLLARSAKKICVAYEGMERFFPEENIVFTGNPVRQNLLAPSMTYHEAVAHFGLEEKKRTVLIVGGSLGARTINESVLSCLELIRQQDEVQFIWQTGSFYHNEIADALRRAGRPENLIVTDFTLSKHYYDPQISRIETTTEAQATALNTLISANPAIFEASLDKVEARYGSLRGYLTECIGVTPEMMETLRERFLE